MENYYKAHPIIIASYLKKYLILLIIPLMRGFFAAVQSGITGFFSGEWLISWFKGAWIDILAASAIIAAAVLRWYAMRFNYCADGLYIKKGVAIKKHTFIPAEKTALLQISKTPLSILLKSANIAAVTQSRACAEFPLRTAHAAKIFDAHTKSCAQKIKDRQYKPKNSSIMILSALNSNYLGGIIFLATLINQSGKLFGGDFLMEGVLSGWEYFSQFLSFGLPSVASGTAYLIFVGWLVGFCVNVAGYKDLSITRSGCFLVIERGFFTRREGSLHVPRIGCLDIRQSILTKIIGLSTVCVHAVSAGKDKEHVHAIIPVEKRRHQKKDIALLLPEYKIAARTIWPDSGTYFKFIMQPLLLCAVLIICTVLAARRFNAWSSAIYRISLILLLPLLWFLTVRVVDYLSSGAGHDGDFLTLRYSAGFAFHTAVMEKDQIARVEIIENIFDRRKKRCDMQVHTFAGRLTSHRLRGLRLRDAQEVSKWANGTTKNTA